MGGAGAPPLCAHGDWGRRADPWLRNGACREGEQAEREASPAAAIIDRKTREKRRILRRSGGRASIRTVMTRAILRRTQEIKGKTRHVLVDAQGLLMGVIVHRAGIQDCDGGALLLSTPFGRFPFLESLFAGGAYQGPIFADTLAAILPRVKTEIVKRCDRATGFVTLPKRWIVERSIAWPNRCRRLAKDWENLNATALVFLRFASIRLMLRKLCNG